MATSKNNQTVNFKRANKKLAIKRLSRSKAIRIAMVCLLAVIIGISGFVYVGETRRSGIADSFRAIPQTLGDSPGYPYSGNDISLEKVMVVGDKPMLISTNCVRVLSQEADQLLEIYPDFAEAKAFSQNGRAVIYSNSSNRAYLISRTSKLAEFKEEGFISVAAVGNNGSVALSFPSKKEQSIVKVYSPKQKNIFQWNCSKDYVTSLSLSNGGKKVLISAMGVENAEVYSRVLLFDVGDSKPKVEKTFKDTAILKVNYTPSNKLIAIGNNKTVILNGKGETLSEIKYSEDSLYAIDTDSDGNTLLCYKEFGGSKIKVVTISSNGKTKEFELNYAPACVDFKNGNIAAAIDNTVIIYSTTGVEKKKYECKNNVGTALITSTGIFTLEGGTLCKY